MYKRDLPNKPILANAKVQEHLETAILRYQEALNGGNERMIDKAYKKICSIYPPHMHMQEWYGQYKYLFDSYEDFAQDYIRIFCNVLSNWKPRGVRKKSRYDGSGEFKNYFIGALQHNYINMVKADNAGKRNPSQKCPICSKWVNPLSTHVLNCHADLLWANLESKKMSVEVLQHCPFCKSHKMPKSFECLESCENKISGACEDCKTKCRINAIKRHFLSKHSSMLFQIFNDLYPNYQTISPRALSVYMRDDEEEENCVYDQIQDENRVDDFLKLDMNEIETLIVENALSGNSIIKFDAKLYKCTIDEFNNALENIKTKLSLVGLEG